ncbi:MAG: DUF3592 domain-containing protein [Pseudomonadota bacterium]
MIAKLIRHGGAIGLLALVSGLVILVIDWTRQLDAPDERIKESIVSDIGGAALVLTGAAILAVLWLRRGDAGRFQTEGRATEAEIEAVRLSFFGTEVRLRFDDAAGVAQRVTLRGSNLALRPGLAPGTRVPIRYDPENPRRLRFQDALDSLAPRD